MREDQQDEGQKAPDEASNASRVETAETGPLVEAPKADQSPPASIRAAQRAHGWRWFAVEYAVVALGVLTALGLEQAVENYHARSVLAETRAAIELDLKEAMAMASESMVEGGAQCQERQFAALTAAVSKGDLARANELIGMSHIFQALPLSDAAWTTALASGVTNGFTPEERVSYAGAYFLARHRTDFQVEYFRRQARFEQLVGSEFSTVPDASSRALEELVEMQAIATNSRNVMIELRRNAQRVFGQTDIEPEAWQVAFVAECESAADAMSGSEAAT